MVHHGRPGSGAVDVVVPGTQLALVAASKMLHSPSNLDSSYCEPPLIRSPPRFPSPSPVLTRPCLSSSQISTVIFTFPSPSFANR